MSKWREMVKNASEKPERGGEGGVDYDEFPILSEALAGVPGTATGTWEVRPQSLTLWVEGPWVKFVLGCEGSDVKTFGSFQGLSKGLSGVEEALTKGNCEVKKVSPRKLR